MKFFRSPNALREWLEAKHNKATELWMGFYKKDSGKTGTTYLEALDEALCYGWIDGRIKRIDQTSHMIRFTPRKPNSTWSARNIQRVGELTKLGHMRPSGLKAFTSREKKKSGIYSYESKTRNLNPECEKKFKEDKTAWRFFEAQPPSYKKVAQFWVMSPKQEATRVRRLTKLMEESRKRLRMDWMTKYSQRK